MKNNHWKQIKLNNKIYTKKAIKILISIFLEQAIFNLEENEKEYILKYKNKPGYILKEEDIYEELNYILFIEDQRKTAEPIRNKLIEGLVKNLANG